MGKCNAVVTGEFGLELGLAQFNFAISRVSDSVSVFWIDAFHRHGNGRTQQREQQRQQQQQQQPSRQQRQSGKSGVCNVLHLTGVVLVQCHPSWMLPCNAKPHVE